MPPAQREVFVEVFSVLRNLYIMQHNFKGTANRIFSARASNIKFRKIWYRYFPFYGLKPDHLVCANRKLAEDVSTARAVHQAKRDFAKGTNLCCVLQSCCHAKFVHELQRCYIHSLSGRAQFY